MNDEQTLALEILKLEMEAWKKTVEVQQHFNTIEMQIRNLAVTVLTTVIGAAVLVYNQAQQAVAAAIKEGGAATVAIAPPTVPILLGPINLELTSADLILVAGLVAWWAFYFMDRWWYHRLLKGARDHVEYIENRLKGQIPSIALSSQISTASPIWKIHSEHKIDFFYGTVALILVVIIFCF
ncbi:MAG TPA: hypothetical protein VF707_20165 [Ardenticatenaceae bacterium]|jgi:hypothetical protein